MSRLFEKLAAKERGFRNSEFLGPVLRGSQIQVRIDGVVMSLNVTEPKNFEGWGIFQPLDFHNAVLLREPTLKQRKDYLALFPSVRLVVCRRKEQTWFAAPLTATDARFGLTSGIPIGLAESCMQFDTIVARFDGQQYWFDQHDRRTSRKLAGTLRECLRDSVVPEFVDFKGAGQTVRDVYEFALLRKLENERDPDEIRLRKALAHGGGTYESHREHSDCFFVTFTVDGESHHSTVRKSDLQIQSSGICLSGLDTTFDLHSLVGVLREGHQQHLI